MSKSNFCINELPCRRFSFNHIRPFYPHNGVQLSLYVCLSVYLFLCLSVSLSGRPRRVLVIIHAARNCAHRMRLQAMGLNTLSDDIICPSIHSSIRLSVFPSGHPVVRGPFAIFVFMLISCVGVQHWDAFIPTLGSEGPHWDPVDIIWLSLCLSVRSSASIFGVHFCGP